MLNFRQETSNMIAFAFYIMLIAYKKGVLILVDTSVLELRVETWLGDCLVGVWVLHSCRSLRLSFSGRSSSQPFRSLMDSQFSSSSFIIDSSPQITNHHLIVLLSDVVLYFLLTEMSLPRSSILGIVAKQLVVLVTSVFLVVPQIFLDPDTLTFVTRFVCFILDLFGTACEHFLYLLSCQYSCAQRRHKSHIFLTTVSLRFGWYSRSVDRDIQNVYLIRL